MGIIKYVGIFLIVLISFIIGKLYSQRFTNRISDLEEFENALEIFKAKIKFTYKPIPDVFEEISMETKKNIGKIFLKSSENMQKLTAGEAWKNGIESEKNNTNFSINDIEIIKQLAPMLGNVDLESQISNIELVINFLNKQLEDARIEKNKNEKLYKTLGIGIGLVISIVLI